MKNRYNIRIIVRIALIGLMMSVFFYAIQQHKWYMTSGVSGIFTLLLLFELLRYVHRSERELAKFLMAIKQKDFTGQYSVKPEKKDFLNESFYEIVQEFTNIRIEKESHYQLLTSIVEHLRTALISFDSEGKVGFFNKAARDILHLKHLRNIEDLATVNSGLYQVLRNIVPGKSHLLKIRINGELHYLSVSAVEFRMKDVSFMLTSLQDIRSELDEQELESWKKLIKILRHEIMNSVTPIVSLSTALNKLLKEEVSQKEDNAVIDMDSFEDLESSLQTIENRSKGLLRFVDAYRSLTKIPKPNIGEFDAAEMIKHVTLLLSPEFKGISLYQDCDDNIRVKADRELLEQVLINILLNAREAMKDSDNPEITVIASQSGSELQIKISDNGCGMDEETLSQAFIPFFTTKKEGSGVGLSLSRQIIQMHKGRIEIRSEVESGSEVLIYL